jgi:hypothetical protein
MKSELDEIRDMDIMSFLAEYGYKPVKENDHKAWYLSPIREGESKPSFYVIIGSNRWVDMGLDGRSHSIIDLVCSMESVDVRGAINILKSKSGIKKFEHKEISKEPLISVIDTKPVENSYLKEYLTERCISKKHWGLVEECKFKFKQKELKEGEADKTYFAIGFKNDSGGYELRNKFQKLATSPKDVTTITGTINELSIFEGFFDYLSALEYFGSIMGDVIILNGLGMLYRIKYKLSGYGVIHSYLDQGNAADKFTDFIRTLNPNLRDHRYLFKGADDFNKFLVKIKINGKA